jgi:hypothetical protein
VDSVLAAEAAILVELELFGRVFLVLHRVVVSLLAFVAAQYNLNAHVGTSIFVCLPALY